MQKMFLGNFSPQSAHQQANGAKRGRVTFGIANIKQVATGR